MLTQLLRIFPLGIISITELSTQNLAVDNINSLLVVF